MECIKPLSRKKVKKLHIHYLYYNKKLNQIKAASNTTMKPIKYLMMGALLIGFSSAAVAQDGTAADVAAVKQLIKSKPADLVKQMKPFYSKNKKNAENLVAFGRAFFEANDTANAKDAANRALTATKRQYAPAYLLLGDVAVLGDDGGLAAQNYEMAIHFDPKAPDAYRKYANVYRKIDPTGAVAKLEELRQQRPDYPVDALIGHINYLSLRYGSAIEAYERVPMAQMQKMDFIEYSFSNYFAKRYAKALEVAEAGLAKEPNNATLTRLAMFSSTETEKYADAIRYADILFNQLNKDSVNLSEMDYLNYGNALSGNKQFEEAIKQYQAGITLVKDDKNAQADLYRAISDAYKELEDYPNSIDNYKKYLDLGTGVSANDFASLGSLAMRYARSQEGDAQTAAFQKADQIWTEFIEKYPKQEAYGLFQRAMANASMDADMSKAQAKPYFDQLIQKITTSGEELDEQDKTFLVTAYRYMMSYNYQVLKDKKAALDYATKMLELKPDDEGIRQAVESLSK